MSSPKPLRRGTSRPHEAFVQLRKKVVVNLWHFASDLSNKILESVQELDNLYADGSSILEQFEELEDILKNTTPTDSAQTALEKVLKFDANVDVAVNGVKDSLLETLSHLDQMETVMVDFQSAVEDLHGHVVSSPSIPRVSEHTWKAERKFDALVRASQKKRPSSSKKIRVLKPVQQQLRIEQTGSVVYPSMGMSTKRMKEHIQHLRHKLSPSSPVNSTTRARLRDELNTLEEVLLNREHDWVKERVQHLRRKLSTSSDLNPKTRARLTYELNALVEQEHDRLKAFGL